ILARRRDPLAVVAEAHAADEPCVPAEGEDLLARFDIPELQRPVIAAADEARAVGAEGDADDLSAVAPEGPDLGARCHVPELECVVIARRGEDPAVGTDLHPEHGGRVSLEAEDP